MKKLTAVLTAAALALSLTGCILKSGDELLSLPKPPSDYLMLQNKLDIIMMTGAVLTSPDSGINQAPIQLVDLDGDGEPEAISLFKLQNLSDQFRIYVHKKDGEGYREAGFFEGHGDRIESVSYPRISSDGERSILVSWRLGTAELGLTVCLYGDTGIKEVLETEYASLVVDDLDLNGSDEIITIRRQAKDSHFTAKLHEFRGETVKMISEAPFSKEAARIERIISGNLENGTHAVFADSSTQNAGLVTDILVKKGNSLLNLSLSDAAVSGDKTVRKLPVNCTDVNLDGVVEVPFPERLPGYEDHAAADAQWSILWNRFTPDGSYKSLFRTYHNFYEEWFLVFKKGWSGNITVSKETVSSIRYTKFNQILKNGATVSLLRIYAFTGDDRETLAKSGGFIFLGSSASASYAAVIPKEAGGMSLALTEKEIKEYFHLIPKEWETEDY